MLFSACTSLRQIAARFFCLLLLLFQRCAAVILSGTITCRRREAGKINVNGVLVPVVQRVVHPPFNLKQFAASEQQQRQWETHYSNGFGRISTIDAVTHEIARQRKEALKVIREEICI